MSGRTKDIFPGGMLAAPTILLVLFTLLLAIRSAPAQVLYGSLTGTVTDNSGAVIPEVAVTLTNQGTGETRNVKANSLGSYSALNLLPGDYTVAIAKTGNFASYTQKNIHVEVNRQVRLDVTLQPASVSAQITVNESPAELQTENAEVNNEISQTQLGQLPITSTAGRNFQSLYSIIPGSAAVVEKNSTASNPSRAMSVNVNGTNYNGNTTRIDGAVNYYGWLPYLIAYVPPADSIENVSFTTNDFNAEQGQAGGATVKITTRSGGSQLHGSGWEYYQDAALNARGYTVTTGSVPKNVFHEFGFNVGGPVYLPHLFTGKKKLFFFENFERTTRRQMLSGLMTVPDTAMIGGDFTEATSYATLYDPQPLGVTQTGTGTANGYLLPGYRTTTFLSEYGCNCIPASRQSSAAKTMIANLSGIASKVTATSSLLASGMANDYYGTGTYAYNRTTNDAKINYNLSENTQIFGKYSVEPFQVVDPQNLGAAGGGTFDGGQPGAAHGRIQNVGLGVSHIFSSSLVLDADFGFTRQVTGAQSTLDESVGDYGSTVLNIPGTNGTGPDYEGQPIFSFNSTFSTIGNAGTANPFLFRDNQFTGDVNLSWVKGKHTSKFGFTYYHFDLNHFQPTSGGGVSNVRGGFLFQGGMTCTGTCSTTAYNALADFLLGLPNNGTGQAVAKAEQMNDPNSLRWTEVGAYAQDQWAVSSRLTLSYGIRYEAYPAPYRNHTGVYILNPALPQSANVEIGDVNGNPKNAGIDTGFGQFVPRVGLAYRVNDRTVVRSGFGITTDPDSMRYLRDSYPEDSAPSYVGTATGSIAVDPSNTSTYTSGAPMTLSYGIPKITFPNISSGFVSLPISGSTNTAMLKFRRGYIESWNLFVQRDLGWMLVANVGYVGNHTVRQQAGISPYNAAPLPSSATPCMPNGQYNTSLTGLTGACSFNINETINWTNCTSSWTACYNTGGITVNGPIFSANYNGLQTQLTRNGGKNSAFGVVYTWSSAFNYEDNGAGSGANGTTFNYPAYYKMNRARASFDYTHNLQVWAIYSLPFGRDQRWANHGLASQIVGGFKLNGQFSHISGAPFSVTANSNTLNTPGTGSLYGQLVSAYQQQGGHNRTFGNTAVSGGRAWFNPAAFANPSEPSACIVYNAKSCPTPNTTNAAPVWPNTHRNQFRGPGQSVFNASIFRAIALSHGTEFQIRFEAFNLFNHALLNNPNTTIPSTTNVTAGNYGTFGLITSYGSTRSLQFGGRINF